MSDIDRLPFEHAAATLSRWTESVHAAKDFERVAASISEDVVVLVPQDEQYVVAGRMVAVPSGWSIRQKLGLSVSQTHDTVPGFAEHLQSKTDRMLRALRPGKYVERSNLIFNPSANLTLFPESWDNLDRVRESLAISDVADTLHLRTEFQSFARCDTGDSCLFCIRIDQVPMGALTHSQRMRLKQVIESWSPAILEYKRITPMRTALLQFLT